MKRPDNMDKAACLTIKPLDQETVYSNVLLCGSEQEISHKKENTMPEDDDDMNPEWFDSLTLEELLALPVTPAIELRSYVQHLNPKSLGRTVFQVTSDENDNVIIRCDKGSKPEDIFISDDLKKLLEAAQKQHIVIASGRPFHHAKSVVSMGDSVIHKQCDRTATIGF